MVSAWVKREVGVEQRSEDAAQIDHEAGNRQRIHDVAVTKSDERAGRRLSAGR